MTWGRSESLTAAYHGPAGLPAPREGQIPGHWKSAPTGSRGGAPLWVMKEAWMPLRHRKGSWKKIDPTSNYDRRGPLEDGDGHGADPDGFAVFGRFPKGWLEDVLRLQFLGDVHRDDILHVCSGTLTEKWTVDIRAEARPAVQASGTALPFRDASFAAVMLDPPYSDEYAKNLYRTENPRPSWLLKEAARVVRPGGRVGILHVAIPFAPPACWLVGVWGISTGVGFRIRAFTIYQREQEGLFGP